MDLIPALVTTELPAAEHADRSNAFLAEVRRAKLPVLQIVTALGPYLTSEDDAIRTRAIALLAQNIAQVPEVIQSSGDVQHLATFFTGRLTDWPAIRGALNGCLALLDLLGTAQASSTGAGGGPQELPCLAAPEAVQMMAAFASHVFVRSLGQQDRWLALSLLCKAMEVHGQALLESRQVDLLESVIASLDGEKDPRCLLLGLRCVRCAVALYVRQPPASLHALRLEEAAEELFDVTAAYFPVAFTPPPNDPHRITRTQLAGEVEATLAASPLFADPLVPLVLEKLGSSLRQAKLDSLSLLGACALRWGPAPLAGYVSAIWAGLRAELLPPDGAVGAGAPLAAPAGGGDEVHAAAAKCLTQCIKGFAREGHWGLLDALWEDAAVQDLFACLPPSADAGEGQGGGGQAFARRVGRVQAATRVLAAVCEAGPPAASQLHQRVLPKVLPLCTAPASEPPAEAEAEAAAGRGAEALVSRCLALGVLVALLEAEGAAAGGEAGTCLEPALLEQVLLAALARLPPQEAGAAGAEGGGRELWAPERGQYTVQREAGLRLRAAHAVFSVPGAPAQLPASVAESAAHVLVACVLSASPPGAKEDACTPDSGASSVAAAAAGALHALAADGSHAQLVAQGAVPPLAAAASAAMAAASGAGPAARRAALEALQVLAGSHAVLRQAVLSHLDRAVQEALPAAVAQPPRGPAGAQAEAAGSLSPQSSPLVLAEELLEAAQQVLSAGATGAPAAEVASFACHLFGAVMALPATQAGPGGMDPRLLDACAAAVFQAVCLAAEPGQRDFLASSGCLKHLVQLSAGLRAPAVAGEAPAPRAQCSVPALQLAVCSAALAGLRPAVLSSAPGMGASALGEAAGALLDQALAPGVEQGGGAAATGAGADGWAMLSAASMLNKWQPDGPELHRAIHGLLEGRLFSLTLGSPGVPEPETSSALLAGSPGLGGAAVRRAWACLALMTRGLVMRGHPAGDGVLAGVLGLLSEAEQAGAGAGAPNPEVVAAAAQLFGEVLSPSNAAAAGGAGGADGGGEAGIPPRPGLSPASHAVARPLWQQRLYTLQAAALLRALGSASSAPGPAGTAPEAGEAAAASPLLLALSELIRGAPPAVLRADWPRMLPWVVRCLGARLVAGSSGEGGAVPVLLDTLGEALMAEEGRRLCGDLLATLVPALLGALQYRPSHQVRERAAQALLLLVQLPYASLHPYRGAITRGLVQALDDDRRAVRLQAAQARQAWAL